MHLFLNDNNDTVLSFLPELRLGRQTDRQTDRTAAYTALTEHCAVTAKQSTCSALRPTEKPTQVTGVFMGRLWYQAPL